MIIIPLAQVFYMQPIILQLLWNSMSASSTLFVTLDDFHAVIVLVLFGVKNICLLISLHVIPEYIWYVFSFILKFLIIFY